MLKSELYISIKPIYLMGFVILGVIVLAASGALWVLKFKEHLLFWIIPAPQITNWGILIAALVAMVGWLVTSIITTRNSIKQHTVTTLLQTRLSAEYMKHAAIVNNFFEKTENTVDKDFFANEEISEELKSSLSYIFNYVEFLSAGLRTGDFDHLLLRMTMKGIFKNLYQRCQCLLTSIREKNPNSMEHFVAVSEYWIKLENKEKKKIAKK